FDNEIFEAVVTLTINEGYKLPKDSNASIFTSGLLGEQYVALEAGGDLEDMQPNDQFVITQSALVLEKMIGQFLFKAAEGGGGE
ncbi:MAG TPA: MCE family protein, partial [Gammaproteobacteria bacterium]|nr:MCE family protein [Gammaproteobacteria bacterium]